MTKYAAIILAAGRGERSGRENGPKQYRTIGGKSVLRLSVEAFVADAECTRICVVRHSDDEKLCSQSLGDLATRVEVVTGGHTRQISTLNALNHFANDDREPPAYVFIHDAARPYVDQALLERINSALRPTEGVVPALPVSDTLKRASTEGHIKQTVSRNGMFAAQTPQAFPFEPILKAHRMAQLAQDIEFTDDSSIAEWAGLEVKLAEGSVENMKLTWRRDLELADERARSAVMPDVRTGNGYDVHSFVPGDHLWLGGVRIDHDCALNGHSDSDVALHALTDALLATCAQGDIGTHFPPSDPQWRGCSSAVFVKHAASLLRERGGRIANVDISLICEAPRIGIHRAAMTKAIAHMLEIAEERVSVKATTNEKLGFIGRKEGIAAIATASVVFPGSLA